MSLETKVGSSSLSSSLLFESYLLKTDTSASTEIERRCWHVGGAVVVVVIVVVVVGCIQMEMNKYKWKCTLGKISKCKYFSKKLVLRFTTRVFELRYPIECFIKP